MCLHRLFENTKANVLSSTNCSWMLGPVWPTNGEIDIMEGMNAQTRNLMTLHTLPGCDVIVGKYGQTGTSGASSQCGAGCSVSGSSTAGYGTGFNNVGGGVFVLKWTSDSIKIWQFNRGRVPPDIAAGRPKPTAWGVPAASFAGCEFDNYFRNMSIVSTSSPQEAAFLPLAATYTQVCMADEQ